MRRENDDLNNQIEILKRVAAPGEIKIIERRVEVPVERIVHVPVEVRVEVPVPMPMPQSHSVLTDREA